MAIIVVGGSGRGVGKTSLLCGLIAALPERCWTAVKITTHEHGKLETIWEQTEPERGSDTARYLAAGASRALLIAAPERGFPIVLSELAAKLGPGANVIFESNRILKHLKPDLCLMVLGAAESCVGPRQPKPSFSLTALYATAMVARAAADRTVEEAGGSKPLFHLAELARVSPEMLAWVRSALRF